MFNSITQCCFDPNDNDIRGPNSHHLLPWLSSYIAANNRRTSLAQRQSPTPTQKQLTRQGKGGNCVSSGCRNRGIVEMAQEVIFDSGLSLECNPKINNQLTLASVASSLSLPPGHDINSATTVTARGSRSGAEPTAHGSIGAWSSPKSNSKSIL